MQSTVGVWPFAHSGSTWFQQGGRLPGGGVGLEGDGNRAVIGTIGYPPLPTFEPPELGRCKRTKLVGYGNFSSGVCTVEKVGNYEWFRGAGTKPKFTSKITEGTVTLETVHGFKVVCTGASGFGEYSGVHRVAAANLKFSGCEHGTEACASSGAAPGELLTSTLEGILGIEKLGKTPKENKVGLALSPVGSPGYFMQFACGTTGVAVRGSVILPQLANKMLLAAKLKFVQSAGKQKPEKFIEGPRSVLKRRSSVKITQTNEESIEINTVV